jgi:iron(III) transport system ATP-binding protein
MTRVAVEHLNKQFDGKPPTLAIDDLSIDVAEGEFLVLLGPSGCGKTTTLRCLAGLETADSGSIRFGQDVMFDRTTRINLPAERRNIGMVFQSYALWPHMTVRKNIAYPLKARKKRQGLAEGWVEETARAVDCQELLDRYPGQLSGGQQQRVALARGLVARPDLVLFDEPLSNLDARLRELVRNEIAELHARLGFTAVYVTHDQSEALALGSRMAIMRSGRIEQLDTPENVFASPASEYVAAFIGMANQLALVRHAGAWRLGSAPVSGIALVDDRQELVVRVRPDDLVVHKQGQTPPPGLVAVEGQVVVATFGGRHLDVVVAVGDHRLSARVPTDYAGLRFDADESVTVTFPLACAALYEPSGQRVDAGPVLELARTAS